MKIFFRYSLFFLLLGLCIDGTAKAFLGYSPLFAFSHSLDVHADKEAVEKSYKEKVKQEERNRKEKEEARKRAEEQKKLKDLKDRLAADRVRRAEEKAKEAREELERQKKLRSK